MNQEESLPFLSFEKDYFTNHMSAVIPSSEYLSTCDFLIRLFSRQKDGERLLAERKGMAKELLDEMHPIAVFADRYLKVEAPGTSVQWIPGNQKHDAAVWLGNERFSNPAYLEVTCIEDRSHHQLRAKVAAEGGASYIVNYSEEMERTLVLLDERLTSKCEKLYPPGTALLIYVKDKPPLGWGDFARRIVGLHPVALSKFARVCIFDRQKTYFDKTAVRTGP